LAIVRASPYTVKAFQAVPFLVASYLAAAFLAEAYQVATSYLAVLPTFAIIRLPCRHSIVLIY